MGLRSAAKHSSLITVLLLLGILWTVVTAIDVAGTMGAYETLTAPYVGQSFVGGVVGLIGLGVLALVLLYAIGELGESEPGPETFPPQE